MQKAGRSCDVLTGSLAGNPGRRGKALAGKVFVDVVFDAIPLHVPV